MPLNFFAIFEGPRQLVSRSCQARGPAPPRTPGLHVGNTVAAPLDFSGWEKAMAAEKARQEAQTEAATKINEAARSYLDGQALMQIFVLMDGTKTLHVTPDTTLRSLKEKIAAKTGVPPRQQRLTYGGKPLHYADEQLTVASFNIRRGSTVHLSVSPQQLYMHFEQLAMWEQKAARALNEDGFALHPLDQRERMWHALELFLRTHPSQLGKGKDVTRAYGSYNELCLASAWRIEHPKMRRKYVVAKENMTDDMKLLARRGVNTAVVDRVQTAACSAQLSDGDSPEGLSSDVSEAHLLHGTLPGKLLSVLHSGLDERYSGSGAGTIFGDGVYLAEDVGKADQYGAVDKAYNKSDELHRRLYGRSYRHQGSVFYVLVCRTLLGYAARTVDTGSAAKHMETGELANTQSGRKHDARFPNLTRSVRI